MVRENFEQNLEDLQEKMVQMIQRVQQIIESSYEAMATQNIALASEVIGADVEIDELENELNRIAVWLTAKEQPVARDLRRIISIIKVSAGIERIADFAVNVSKSTIEIAEQPSLLYLTSFEDMKNTVLIMLSKACRSFVEEDIALATQVSDLDHQVDEQTGKNYRALTRYLSENPEQTNHIVQLLFINRYFERMGDHITNIAESTAYLIKGKMYDFN